MTGWKRWLRLAALIVLVIVLYFVVPVSMRADEDTLARIVTSVIVLAILAGIVLWQIVLQLDHPDRRVDGLLLAIVIAVLGFALGFYALQMHDSAQFAELETRLDALYFTWRRCSRSASATSMRSARRRAPWWSSRCSSTSSVLAIAVTTLNSRIRARAEERLEIRRVALEEGVSPRSAVKAAEKAVRRGGRTGSPRERWCPGRRGPAGPPAGSAGSSPASTGVTRPS